MRTDDVRELDMGHIRRGGKSLCWHRYTMDEVIGVWRYRECDRCGLRRADRYYASFHSVIDWSWLEGER